MKNRPPEGGLFFYRDNASSVHDHAGERVPEGVGHPQPSGAGQREVIG